jgi:hypothetical protein
MKSNDRARIILAVNPGVFIEFANSVRYALESFGIPTEIYEDENAADYGREYRLTFVIKALRKFPLEGRIRGTKILLQTEELWNRREWDRYDLSSAYHRVLEMYDENVKITYGTENVVYCPVGYSPVWESNLPDVEEDIDVLFHGSITPRRREFEAAIMKMGLRVMFTDQAYGVERDKLIKRSKIDINIKAHDKWSYGPMHCLPAQANKKFMLAEKANGGYGPFKPGVHVQEYNGLTDCLNKIEHWISHDKERKEFALSAYDDMVKTCNYTNIFRNALGNQKGMGSLI